MTKRDSRVQERSRPTSRNRRAEPRFPLPRILLGQIVEPRRKAADEEPADREKRAPPDGQERIPQQEQQEDRPQDHHYLRARPEREARDEPEAPQDTRPAGLRRRPRAPSASSSRTTPNVLVSKCGSATVL